MKNYQFNLLFGAIISIHVEVMDKGWLSVMGNFLASYYIIVGAIQQWREKDS